MRNDTGSEITYFPSYTSKENRTTNYCLLILKMLYQESPALFEEFITSLVGEELKSKIGVSFVQQKVIKISDGKKTIPDGVIKQEPFTLYIETKNNDWFYKDQLKNHLEALSRDGAEGTKVLIALANFDNKEQDKFNDIRNYCSETYENKIILKEVSFEDLILQIEQLNLYSQNLKSIITDFKSYLEEHDLLPIWKYQLDVVNCARSMEEVIRNQVYTCPAPIGAYKHNKSKYFGIYKDKEVKYISEIRAVTEISEENSIKIKWNISETPDEEILEIAMSKLDKIPAYRPIQMFILSSFMETSFKKETPGGMFGSKQYFRFANINNIKDLAEKLKVEKW